MLILLLPMTIFQYESYKKFFKDWVFAQPKSGYGQYRQLALFLNLNSVVISQIFNGDRELSLEHAIQLCNFVGLSDLERDYFLLLVQKDRSGSSELKTYFLSQLEQIKRKSLSLKNRVQHQKMDEESKAVFYSHWYYSAIRLTTAIPGMDSANKIAEYLNLEAALVKRVLDFLIKYQLIVEEKGKFKLGPQVTHIDANSPNFLKHHINWRIKSIQSLERQTGESLHYSGPMVLSKKMAAEIRETLVKLIQDTTKRVIESEDEKLTCLNIDWFNII